MSGKIDSSDYSSSSERLFLFRAQVCGYTLGRQGEIFCIAILGQKVVAKVATEALSWFTFERCGVPFFQIQFASKICK